jgi:hypothetical protein
MFIVSIAKVRQINDITKYFVLKNVNMIDLFSIKYNHVQAAVDPFQQVFNLSEIKS